MKYKNFHRTVSLVSACVVGAFSLPSPKAETPLPATSTDVQSVSFLGVAAGDVSATDATVWTRAINTAAPTSAVALTTQVSSDQTFSVGISTFAEATEPSKDYTAKLDLTGLQPGTVYYYRFVGPGAETSNVGKFKTAPLATTSAPVHFAFSGDMDGLMRPYPLSSTIPSLNLDFYVNLGDLIYETGSNVAGDAGTSNLNSPAVTLSGNIPAPSSTGATTSQLFSDYSRKYREQFLPVNLAGQNGLKDFYAAQGNYSFYDNHELGNRQYINGGAPAGGPVGDAPTGAGVDARLSIYDSNPNGPFMNKSAGFQTLQQVYLNYQPVADRGIIAAPGDPRTDQTKRLYFAQPWGKNAIFISVDDRSYRDIRMKTAANADDTGPRADATNRTMLGATQLAWLEQTLLDAQTTGTIWKFIGVSDPIDQLGPIGGALTLNNLPSFGTGSSYTPVSADGGKSWQGGYRAERNALLKFIADHQIINVVFLSTDDHQNRVNELMYSTTGETSVQSTYVKVPYCFEIVAGPLGATGPDLITNHTFTMAQQLADSLATAQTEAGIEPIGLQGYPGLKNVFRENDPNANVSPSAVDFYSPDTFNYNTLDVSADGKTLTVTSIGMNATTQNSALEYGANGNTARPLFSFQVEASPGPSNLHLTLNGYVLNRRSGHVVQQVSVRNDGNVPTVGPIYLALDQLSSGTTLTNGAGLIMNNPPIGSAYATITNASLSSGQTATTVLEFAIPPANTGIIYTPRLITGPVNP